MSQKSQTPHSHKRPSARPNQPRGGPGNHTSSEQHRRNGSENDGYHTRHHVEDGMYPNPWWRTLTRAELRWQKLYRALPPAEDVATHDGLEWLSFLRQDTPIFDNMIQGRLTGRDILAVVGAHEPSAARKMGLPHNMVGHEHALTVIEKLSQPVMPPPEPKLRNSGEPHDEESASKTNRMLVLKYNSGCAPYTSAKQKPASRPRVTAEECPSDIVQLRQMWSAEQSSSGLYALGQHNPHGMVEECGLVIPTPDKIPQAWGFSDGELPPLASAPAAKLKTSRNRDALERIVEIYSTCPYVYYAAKGCFAREHRTPNDQVQPWWLPQLQWDLYFGDCEAGCIVSQSATRGMNVFTVKRNDEYVHVMLRLVRKFYTEFVQAGIEPPANFFWESEELAQFLSMSVKLAAQSNTGVERVSTVRRAVKRQPFFIDRPLGDSDEEDEENVAGQPAPSPALPIPQPIPQQQQQQPMQQQQYSPMPMDQVQYQQMLGQMQHQMTAMGMSPQQQYMYMQQYMAMQQQQYAMQMQQAMMVPQTMPAQTTAPAVAVPQYDQQQTQQQSGSADPVPPANALTYEQMVAQMTAAPPEEPAPAPAPAPAPLSEREAAMLELQRRAQQPTASIPLTTNDTTCTDQMGSTFGTPPLSSSFGNSPWAGSSLAPTASFPGAEAWADKPGDDDVWGNKPGQFEDMVTGMLDLGDE